MLNIILGCDPDSTKHGVAVYVNGTLKELLTIPLLTLMDKLIELQGNHDAVITVHIENVRGVSNSGFHHKRTDSVAVRSKKSEHVGQCKQAQIEVERLCEYLNVPVVKHKISKQWKDANGKKVFERVTGWTGRSNEDSRSAAFMGYLGVTSTNKGT